MPRKHAGHGRGGGAKGPRDAGGGSSGRTTEASPGRTTEASPGRSESSPGHLKRDAGEQSARDFAPGRSESQHPDDRGKFLDRPEPPRAG